MIKLNIMSLKGIPGDSAIENLSALQEMQIWFLGQEDPMVKEMVTHFSILAWKIPWTEESRGSQRVRHDWAHTHTHNKKIIYFSVLLCKTFFWIFIYYILKIAGKNKVKKKNVNPRTDGYT